MQRPIQLAAALALLSGSAAAQIRITEFLYSGLDGEFIELTNVGAAPVDLFGWSLDDQTATAGTFDLSAAGVVAPGASIVVTDRIEANFVAAWGLSGVTVLGGNAVAPFGRDDEIHVFDAFGAAVDVLRYGDQDFPGTVRAQFVSAHGCDGALGVDDVYLWRAAAAGDPWQSTTSTNGDVGSPGVHPSVSCPAISTTYCAAAANSTGVPALLAVYGTPSLARNDATLECSALPLNTVGFFLASTTQDSVANPGGSSGTLCLGGSIGRYSAAAQNSGATGVIGLTLDLTALSQPTGPVAVVAGETWSFQCWYRDSILGFPISNFSEGAQVTFF